MSEQNIKRYFNAIDKSLFFIDGNLSYDRITIALTKLANEVHSTEADEFIWSIGEYGNCDLSDLIIGAYWHYTEWHGGQWSEGYAALSALGHVFSPNMSMPENDNYAYQALNNMANATANGIL